MSFNTKECLYAMIFLVISLSKEVTTYSQTQLHMLILWRQASPPLLNLAYKAQMYICSKLDQEGDPDAEKLIQNVGYF